MTRRADRIIEALGFDARDWTAAERAEVELLLAQVEARALRSTGLDSARERAREVLRRARERVRRVT